MSSCLKQAKNPRRIQMTISRKALIIANPGVEDDKEDYLPGVDRDVLNYQRFLKSKVGGAWRASEITTLRYPTLLGLRVALITLSQSDYTKVIFTGHGEYSNEKGTTILQLRPGVDIDSAELCGGNAKRTVILDCCRGIHVPMAVDEATMDALAKADSMDDLSESRRCYDQDISRCPNGLVVLFACSIGQLSGDSDRGGVYSYNLIRAAEAWARAQTGETTKSYYPFSVVAAHEKAKEMVMQQRGSRQTPTIEKPRSSPYFPFGIVA